MVTSRYLEEKDYLLLSKSLENDPYHKDTDLSFFLEEGTVCSVFEYDGNPVLFVRGKPIYYKDYTMIQLDIQYLNNEDTKKNIKVMLEGFPNIEKRAKENKFSGFFFISNVKLLRKFCIKYLGFEEFNEDALIKLIDKAPEDVI